MEKRARRALDSEAFIGFNSLHDPVWDAPRVARDALSGLRKRIETF